MTRRSIQTLSTTHVVVHAGLNVRIMAWDRDEVQAETDNQLLGMSVRGDSSTVEVRLGGSGDVFVPAGSRVTANAGRDLSISGARTLVKASSGHDLAIDCFEIDGGEITLACGNALRCGFRGLPNITFDVKDIGGDWRGRIGDGAVLVKLRAGGVATVVAGQAIEALPPQNLIGNVERFADPQPAAPAPLARLPQ